MGLNIQETGVTQINFDNLVSVTGGGTASGNCIPSLFLCKILTSVVSLTREGRGITIASNDLTSLSFPELLNVVGNLRGITITNEISLASISFPKLETITGSSGLLIAPVPALTSLDLSALETIASGTILETSQVGLEVAGARSSRLWRSQLLCQSTLRKMRSRWMRMLH